MLPQFYFVLVTILIVLVEAQEILPFQTVDQGAVSGIDEPLKEVIRTAPELDEFWERHTEPFFPPPPVPSIDFENEMVICVFLGVQNTGGFSIFVTEVSSQNGKIVVKYDAAGPRPGDQVPFAITQPYHIVKTSSSEFPVRFVGPKPGLC